MANPTAMLLCAANMLNHMNLQFHGDMIRDAVEKVIRKGKVSSVPRYSPSLPHIPPPFAHPAHYDYLCQRKRLLFVMCVDRWICNRRVV